MSKIQGGYYIKARKIQNSKIQKKSPCVREIWDWLLMNANYKDNRYNGFTVKRGQLFRTYKEIREGLAWYVGYRKEMYNENQTKSAMKTLRSLLMIDTTKKPGGVLITILNYDTYQTPENYEATNEATNEATIETPHKPQGVPTIIRKKKESKNKKNKKEPVDKKFCLPCKDDVDYYLTENLKKVILERYPNLDLVKLFCDMRIWFTANPNKLKTKRGMGSFISGWINRGSEYGNLPTSKASPENHDFEELKQIIKTDKVDVRDFPHYKRLTDAQRKDIDKTMSDYSV